MHSFDLYTQFRASLKLYCSYLIPSHFRSEFHILYYALIISAISLVSPYALKGPTGRKHPPDTPVVPAPTAHHSKLSSLISKKKRTSYEKMCYLILHILYYEGLRGKIITYVLCLFCHSWAVLVY